MPPLKCKIIVLGESGVGKSSLLTRYALDTFTDEIAATIGVDFRTKNFKFTPGDSSNNGNNGGGASSLSNEHVVALALWDTAGAERFRALSSSFYRGTDAIICVYDVTSEESFKSVKRWLDQAREFLPHTPALLIANKVDLIASHSKNNNNNSSSDEWRDQEQAKAQDFATEHQMLYCRCSAKTKEGVNDAFEAIAQKACDTPEFKDKLGLNGGTADSQQQQQQSSQPGGAKRIDLNSTRNNNNNADDQSSQGYYGCGQC